MKFKRGPKGLINRFTKEKESQDKEDNVQNDPEEEEHDKVSEKEAELEDEHAMGALGRRESKRQRVIPTKYRESAMPNGKRGGLQGAKGNKRKRTLESADVVEKGVANEDEEESEEGESTEGVGTGADVRDSEAEAEHNVSVHKAKDVRGGKGTAGAARDEKASETNRVRMEFPLGQAGVANRKAMAGDKKMLTGRGKLGKSGSVKGEIRYPDVQTELKACLRVIDGVMGLPEADPFLEPVDPVALGASDYYEIVRTPMDLGTIRRGLEGGAARYTAAGEGGAWEVWCDAELVWSNCKLYNRRGDPILDLLARVERTFHKLWADAAAAVAVAVACAAGRQPAGQACRAPRQPRVHPLRQQQQQRQRPQSAPQRQRARWRDKPMRT
eukprot:jgi/Mesen1/11053/ME000099S10494